MDSLLRGKMGGRSTTFGGNMNVDLKTNKSNIILPLDFGNNKVQSFVQKKGSRKKKVVVTWSTYT